MSVASDKAKNALRELNKLESIRSLAKRVASRHADHVPEIAPIPTAAPYSREGQEARLAYLQKHTEVDLSQVHTGELREDHQTLKGNIENFIGMAQVPIGVAGPISVNGTRAQGDYFVPLATTEGALVASYSRGMKACRMAGGISSVCLLEGIQRSPVFKFKNVMQVGRFVAWCLENLDQFRKICESSSGYARLEDMKTNIEGNTVILSFEYFTGDASGQNMVTIATESICQYILESSPVKPKQWFVESNYSGDKKATATAFSSVRGKKVTAEAFLPEQVVQDVLKTTPQAMVDYWQASTLAVVQSGAIGAQGHVANGLTALFIACGQDVACVSESAIGITRMELEDGGLYASLTLPNLVVGTVGGGTGLPTQRECLELMDCFGTGNARKFAEISAAVCLAGELSIAAALSAGHFTHAHQQLGRK